MKKLVVTVIALLSITAPLSEAQATYPDTPAGRHLRAFIEAFNTGDRDT